PLVNGEVEMVGGDGGSDCRSTLLYGLYGGGSCAVLQYDAELWEAAMKVEKSRQESLFGVENGHTFPWRCFSVEVEDHVDVLHGRKDGVECLIRDDTGIGVGSYACWIRLYASNASFVRLVDDLGSDIVAEVERHEVGD